MFSALITSLRTLNQLLNAGIAITAFSLLLYALSFNLRDRVARSLALILLCVVIVFVADSIASVTQEAAQLEFILRLQWIGIVFLPAAYLHFSDAILATTGRPSRGRRRLAVRLVYALSFLFLAALPFSLLAGPLVQTVQPAPHLERTWLTLIFTIYYVVVIGVAGINLVRAYRRTVTRASRRRMAYLLAGALAPALGSYPYLLFGSGFAARHTLSFWIFATLGNLLVSALLVSMAYGAAFFGVQWPDRVVKRRLFKWLMRGPVTASTVLAITTIVRRVGENFGNSYSAAVPVVMAGSILIMEHLITLAAPFWERWLLYGGDRREIEQLQTIEERLLTSGDLRQFLEAILAAACDRMQSSAGFAAGLGVQGLELIVTLGGADQFEKEDLSNNLLAEVENNHLNEELFSWGDFWLVPLYAQQELQGEPLGEQPSTLVGLLGVRHSTENSLDEEQAEALSILAQRAALALDDRRAQQQAFTSLEALTPSAQLIHRLGAAARYNTGDSLANTLTQPLQSDEARVEDGKLSGWVKDALTHYWGGPKLTQSPLLALKVAQRELDAHDGNPANALRALLRQAIESIRPEGERRFTGEWLLYNILEMKFLEGRKVREVALRLAMSEADLYRKQRVAIEAVAAAIVEMEEKATGEGSGKTVEEISTAKPQERNGSSNERLA
jgi:hypothetical protein